MFNMYELQLQTPSEKKNTSFQFIVVYHLTFTPLFKKFTEVSRHVFFPMEQKSMASAELSKKFWSLRFSTSKRWVFPEIGGFPPKSSILIGFSIINHPFWDTPIFGNTQDGWLGKRVRFPWFLRNFLETGWTWSKSTNNFTKQISKLFSPPRFHGENLFACVRLVFHPWIYWLVVSTHLKNISQIGSFPQVGMKIKNIWNHHLVLTLHNMIFVSSKRHA